MPPSLQPMTSAEGMCRTSRRVAKSSAIISKVRGWLGSRDLPCERLSGQDHGVVLGEVGDVLREGAHAAAVCRGS